MSLAAYPTDQSPLGYFRIFARPPGGKRREITIFRDVPIMLESATTTDPFTESVASMNLPQVTIFDLPGAGDLDWLVPDGDIDIVWQNTGDYDFNWRWEGFIASYDFGLDGTTSSFGIELKGALYALDNYIAKPWFPTRPVPYEFLIARSFNTRRHPAGLSDLKISFPDDWTRVVKEWTEPGYLRFLRPFGVTPGQKWTELTSRYTGSFEPLLSSYVQNLLTTMFDESNAQWSIQNRGHRRPELYLRRPPNDASDEIIEITMGQPGVSFTATRDFSQRANTFYGQGRDEAGVTYSGIEVTPDGRGTYFKPFAWAPQVYPRTDNPSLVRSVRGKETMIKFQDGLDEIGAQRVAQAHLQRYADPGITGQINLVTDPRRADGTPFPRMLIRAGATLRLKNLLGIPEGLLVHVTQATVDFSALSISLTVDSKYRDVLTVDEVRARTRDALAPLRALQVGKYSNTVQDLLKPWNYREGSGMIPTSAKTFYLEKLTDSAEFPFTDFTTKYPPSKYPQFYLKIGPTNTENSTKNWTANTRDGTQPLAIPIRMSAAGTIRLTQIAAYDKDGNIMPVRFHASVWKTNGVGPAAMPAFIKNDAGEFPKFLHPKDIVVNYKEGQTNPFIKDAWESVMPDGTQYPNDSYLPRGGSEMKVGWGNYYEPAGYSPGRASKGSARTGKLVDATPWTWDNNDLFDKQGDHKYDQEDASMLYLLIYCDEQGTEPVYFQGRFIRQEPGTGTS